MVKRLTRRVCEQTQRFVLRAVYEFERYAGTNATQAANLMDVPQATIIRAFDELEAVEPGWFATVDAVRWFNPCAGRKGFLQKASPYLHGTAVREYRLDRIPTACGHLPLSGLSAIGHHSTLDIAPYPTFAATKEQERRLGLKEGKLLADWTRWERPACVVQVMRYELDSMSELAIDPISAILSLTDEELEDPRVERAVVGILERVLSD